MRTWPTVVFAALLVIAFTPAAVDAADCPKPETVAGQIVKVDADGGKITLRQSDGKMLEFSASKEVLHDKKVGDRLEITKRMPEGCK